jgi:hypothetical protein
MPDSGTLFKAACANNELKIDPDESDELLLKIDTFDRLHELLRTVKKRDLLLSGESISSTMSTMRTRT